MKIKTITFFLVAFSFLVYRLEAQEDKYFEENVKNRAYDKSFRWVLIFKDQQTEYYLRLGTVSHDREGRAYLIAVHDVKDENTPLYAYHKVANGFVLEKHVVDYLCNSLFPEIKKRMPEKRSLEIRNFIKDVHLSGINSIRWMNEYEGELIKITIAKYAGGVGFETLPSYHLDYEHAMTLKDAKALRESLNKSPISLKAKDSISAIVFHKNEVQSKRMSDFEKIRKNFNIDINAEIEKAEKASRKIGYKYYNDNYWANYGNHRNKTNDLERDILKNIFHGNFPEVRYLLWREQNDKNIWEQVITQNSNVFFVELYCSFIINYSSQCEDFLPENHDVLTLSSQTEDQYGNPIGPKNEGRKVHMDKRFTVTFQNYYPTYADTFRKALSNDTADFIKYKGCECKSVIQLAENILRFAKNQNSIQQSNESISGTTCD